MAGGRPSKFKPEFAEQVFKLCLLGATDEQIADFFGVSVSTVNRWKVSEPEFWESLKRGKAEADATVADSLFNRAIGYTHKDTKFATWEGRITDTQEYDKHHPPDITACIFWLKNRRPTDWRDKQEVYHDGEWDIKVVLPPDLSDDSTQS